MTTTNPSAVASSVIQMEDVTIPAMDDPASPRVAAVNWSVTAGDYWMVGARPGGGKSDLLAVAAGLLRPLRGTHRLFGREISRLQGDEPLPERLRVGLVFEDGGRLFSAQTVRENVALPVRYHRNCSVDAIAEWVDAILDAVGLAGYAHTPAGRLNRSWRQRAALARALALRPEALLLDNPLAGLDLRHAHWWLEFLGGVTRGHPLFNHRPLTLVIAADDLRPWRDQARQFALIEDRRWRPVGDRGALDGCDEPLVRELLADTAFTD